MNYSYYLGILETLQLWIIHIRQEYLKPYNNELSVLDRNT